ncbi:hypothetical protein DFH09DRAFT_1069548 [Mycena vulgaris]|nr:hypothetical protein DFH09DRAFT_1069548 [Mycena vulgaris]
MRRASSEEELQWGRRVECPKTQRELTPGPATMYSVLPEHPHVVGRPNPWPFSGETNPEFDQGSDPRFRSTRWGFVSLLGMGVNRVCIVHGCTARARMVTSVEDGHGEVLCCWEHRVGAECSSSLVGMGHIRMWLLAASR